jgi:4-diphosphocytidyl-2-C-methyl-D-erythritol kinase
LPTVAKKRRRLVLQAAAKVNLGLEILGRRDDGYHEIATVMQAVDLSDRLIIEDAETLEFRTGSPDVPADGANLAARAAATLRDAAGSSRGAKIVLDKRIPVAAGLGGGSADAAAVLIGLNRLWGLRWSSERLAEVAVRLGMDVPFFLRGGVAVGTGRGERLRSIDGGAMALVLVNPGTRVSTAEAYGRVTPALYSDGERVRALTRTIGSRDPARIARHLYNALEDAVGPAQPEIGRVEEALRAAGALGVAMSGSGPTVFGVARSWDHARQIRARVVRGRWSCWAVRGLRGPAIRFRTAERG